MNNQVELDRDLRNENKADKELGSSNKDNHIIEIMQFIEKERKTHTGTDKNAFTQAEIARKTGISRPTYINYSHGHSDNITVKFLIDTLLALKIKDFDIYKFM